VWLGALPPYGGDDDAVLIATPEYNGSIPGGLKAHATRSCRPARCAIRASRPACVTWSPHSSARGRSSMTATRRRSDMSTAREPTNRATTRRFHEAVNTGDAELISKTIDEVFQPDALIRTPLPIDAAGAALVKELFARLRQAFPDLQVAIEDLVAEGDKVVSRNVVTGTHQGEYMGLPPTGRSVTYNEIFILRFVDGRIAETWGVVDVLSQMKQLGLAAP
jgi:steroid delta-isomerase-like uncharacterized protein